VLAQLFNTFNARSDTETIWGRIFSNWWLLAAIAVSIGLQVAVVYLPFLNDAFGTAPLSLADWLLAAGLASTVIWVSELRKAVLRRVTPRSELD
jgi:magnesium-transporting ATPase (P-type)